MSRVAINQSNYIPWKGYFDLIHDVDLFVFYDDVQFTKNDWRNRNRIKTNKGLNWLTIPVGRNINRLICEVKINDLKWAKKHWETICQFYSKSPHFKKYKDFFEFVYLEKKWQYLSDLNQFLIKSISTDFLGIKAKFKDSRGYKLKGKGSDRVLNLLKIVGANIYVSGPSARSYIKNQNFNTAGIKIIYKDYTNYPEYPQQFSSFIHEVSILDLLFNTGVNSSYYIWGWRDKNNAR